MSAPTGVRARAYAVPAWAWVAAVVVVSVAVRFALGHRLVAPWILVDELIYSELAKSFAANGSFLVRGVPSHGYGFVYPMLIAPAWRLYGSIPHAYAAAKAINAVVMSLAAIPAYLLARRLLSPALSVVAAVLTVLVPSMLYTGTLMTENAFYPLFLVVCLALVATLERPTPLRQIGLLALCGIAYATRAQAVAFVPAIAVAPLLHGWIERDVRGRLRGFLTLYGVLAAGVVVALVGTLARGRSPLALLGAYRAATSVPYSVSSVLHYLLWHIAELDLYVGVVPFAALLALWFAPRASSPAARAFVAATLPVTVFVVVEVAAFASTQSGRIEERNMFYLAPFALIALLGLAQQGVVPRVRYALAAAALVAGVLPAAIPFSRFVNLTAVSDTFALLPWWWVQDRGISFSDLRYVALAVGLAAGAAFFFLPRRFALVLPAIVAAYFVLTTAVVENGRHGIRQASIGSLWAGIRVPHPDWVDRKVGRNADVTFLWTGRVSALAIWDNEFFNRSVRTIVDTTGGNPGGLPEATLHELVDGRLALPDGRPVHASYALVDGFTDIAGKPVAADTQIGLRLIRIDGPLLVRSKVTGLYPDPGDTWSAKHVTYTRRACTGGYLSVLLESDPNLYTSDQVVTATEDGATVGTIRVGPTDSQRLLVPLRRRTHALCTVRFTMSTLRVPARVQPGSKDTRPLGIHFLRFDYLP